MFGELIGAMVTPFDDKEEIDYLVVKKLLNSYVESGHSAVVIGGSTGEGVALTYEEKKSLLQFVRENTTLKVIYAISVFSTKAGVEEILNVNTLAPDGYMISSPSYNKPPARGLFLHFKILATAAGEIPVMLYNVPSRTIVSLDFLTIRKLLRCRKNVVALKEATADVNFMMLLKYNFPEFKVYSGDDKTFFEAMVAGADGVVSVQSILYGEEMKTLINDYHNGYKNMLLADYLKIVGELLGVETNPIPIKYLLAKNGYQSMNLRLPLVELSLEGQEKVNLLLKN